MKMFHKTYQAEVKEHSETDLTVTHFISSEARDRGGDVLYAGKNDKGEGMVMGGRVVVLFMHGYSHLGTEPIAKPVWIRPAKFGGRNGIECKTQFFPDDLGKRLWKKTTEGYMPNWSVGWRPLEGKVEIKRDQNGDTRHIYEWELLEYSLVGVPMQQDAQTAGKEAESLQFKTVPIMEEESPLSDKDYMARMETEERKAGELVAWKVDDPDDPSKWIWEEKPYPSEHACRLEDPDTYIRVRRQNNKFGKGIHAIWGVQSGDNPVELQAIRFSKDKFTPKEARAWVKEHDYKCKAFEPAAEKCEKCGIPMNVVWVHSIGCKDIKLDGDCTCDFDVEYDCPNKGDHEMLKDDLCSCDGEKGDDGNCQKCKKPKQKKEEPPKTLILVVGSECPKCLKQLAAVYGADAKTIIGYDSVHECKADENMPDCCSDEDVSVMMVDADQIRKDHADGGFVHGGHHYSFDFIPEPEIWIDQRMTDEDIMELKCSLSMERQCMKYCMMSGKKMSNSKMDMMTSMQARETGAICGKAMRHMMSPREMGKMEAGGHDEGDQHYYEHAGNHWHNRGVTMRYDFVSGNYVIHSLPENIVIAKEHQEAFSGEVDEAIKTIAAKYAPGKPAPVVEKTENPPEPRRVIVVNSEEERKKSDAQRQEALRQVSVQLNEVINRTVAETVKEQFDAVRGKVK